MTNVFLFENPYFLMVHTKKIENVVKKQILWRSFQKWRTLEICGNLLVWTGGNLNILLKSEKIWLGRRT